MSDFPEGRSAGGTNVRSIAERRRAEQNRIAQTMRPLEQRVADIEADLLRAIDLILDMTHEIEAQRGYLHRMIKHLKDSTK